MTRPLSWTIGEVQVTRLLELEQVIAYDPATPFLKDATPDALAAIHGMCPTFVTEQGAIRLSIHSLLVEAPGLRLVVDTCVGNDRKRAFICDEPLQTAFIETMTSLGWPPDSVDAVLCTHMHVDHVGWNTRLIDGGFVPTFPRADYYFADTEFAHFEAHAAGEEAEIFADSIRPIVEAGQARRVACDHRLSPHVRLIPTPGHTIGHVSVVIESGGERAVISGDTIHHPCQMRHPEWMTAWEHDAERALITRRTLLDGLAETQDLLIGTHFAAPTAGHVRRVGSQFDFVPLEQSPGH